MLSRGWGVGGATFDLLLSGKTLRTVLTFGVDKK